MAASAPHREAGAAAAVCQELCSPPFVTLLSSPSLPSPSVGFLQPPGSEQYQMPQSPSPCSPPQMSQQYSGKSTKNLGWAGALLQKNSKVGCDLTTEA